MLGRDAVFWAEPGLQNTSTKCTYKNYNHLQLAYNQVQLLLRFTISHNIVLKLNRKL